MTFARPRFAGYPVVVTKPIALPPPGFDELSAEEKLEYLGDLWRHVVATGDPQITDEQRRLLRERWARHEANPGTARTWSEVRAELESKYRIAE
jgi:putative addiction module component (TIGR02574 family)